MYKNVALQDEDHLMKEQGVNNVLSSRNLSVRRYSELSQESKDSSMSNGKLKTLCFNDIMVANLNGSNSSVNTDRSSTQSGFVKVC